MRLTTCLALAAITFSFVACGHEPHARFAQAYAEAECGRRLRCGWLSPDGRAECEARERTRPFLGARAVAEGAGRFDVARGEVCVAEVAALPCDDVLDAAFALAPACAGVVTGTRGAGGSCDEDSPGSLATCPAGARPTSAKAVPGSPAGRRPIAAG